MGGLLGNTYNSYHLEEGIETEIAKGTGVYYLSNPVSDTISCVVVVNYHTTATLGYNPVITFRVDKSTLYAKSSSILDIRVRKICRK